MTLEDSLGRLRALAERTGRPIDRNNDRNRLIEAVRKRDQRKSAAYDAAAFALATGTSFEALNDLDEDAKLAFVDLVASTPANDLLQHPQYDKLANLLALKERFGGQWREVLAMTNAEQHGQYIGDRNLGQYVGGIADKRLEMEMVRELNAGGAIDGYSLPPGARASLAPPNYETYDVLIHDAEGNLLPSASVKMSAAKSTMNAALADLEGAGGGVLLTNAEAPDVVRGTVHQSEVSAEDLKDGADGDLDAWTESDLEEFREEFMADTGFLGGAQALRLTLRAIKNKKRHAKAFDGVEWGDETFKGGTNFVAMMGANAAEYLLLDAGPAILDIGGFGTGLGLRTAIHKTRNRYRSATTLMAYQALLEDRFPQSVS